MIIMKLILFLIEIIKNWIMIKIMLTSKIMTSISSHHQKKIHRKILRLLNLEMLFMKAMNMYNKITIRN